MLGLHAAYVSLRRRSIYERCLRGASRVLVLRYHSVGEPKRVCEYLDPGLSLTPERFLEQIRFLVNSFEIITPDDYERRFQMESPNRLAVSISFDDGFRDNYDFAFPILRDFGVRAAFYVASTPLSSGHGLWISELWRLMAILPAGRLALDPSLPDSIPEDPDGRNRLRRRITRWFAGIPAEERERALDQLAALVSIERGEGLENSFMNPKHLQEMHAAGMVIGAHSRSHPHLDHLDPRLHEEEVAGSRRDLETILGADVRHFAYPNPSGKGEFGALARSSVRDAGFATASTSRPARIDGSTDLLSIPRLGVYSGAQEKLLFGLLEKAVR